MSDHRIKLLDVVDGAPAMRGHGIPGGPGGTFGDGITWHRADEECDECRAEAAKPKGPDYKVTAVDRERGIFTLSVADD